MKRGVLLLSALLLLSSCDISPPYIDTPPVQDTLPRQNVSLLNPEGKELVVSAEIARTEREQEIGLMGRTELGDNEGMLFPYPQETTLYFWMKGTEIPLDIVFFRSDGSFVSFTTMQPCVAEPCKIYSSAGPARYALEVAAGKASEWGVGEGWILETNDRDRNDQ
jgi:uncharacterized protein